MVGNRINMPNIADYVFYKLVYDYLEDKIDTFGMEVMARMMTWASTFALILVTIYIMVQGFRVMTGRSGQPLMELVINLGRITLVVAAATAMAIGSTDLSTFLTKDLDRHVHYMFTGNDNETTADAIDKNLAYTQLALASIDAVKIVGKGGEIQEEKARAYLIAGFGSASPPMAAGAMLLLYKFAMSLFIGLGPLFILCLIFDQTKDLFRRWLMYGIGTIFSMGLLSAVASMVLELTIRVSAATWGAKILSGLIPGTTEGLTSTAMQTGGIGLLMTVLIVSVPPMAAMFFQGTLGNFLTYSAFGGAGGGGGAPGPQGQPPGSSWVGTRSQGTAGQGGTGQQEAGAFANRVTGVQPVSPQDTVKSSPSSR
jgi:type IV secretion system protein VirB6